MPDHARHATQRPQASGPQRPVVPAQQPQLPPQLTVEPQTVRPVRHDVALPLIAICSTVVAACMAFGSPGFWMTEKDWAVAQEAMSISAANTDASAPREDVQVTIGEYTAESESADDDRCENIRLAAESINGKVIGPGETFSFNEAVGDTTNDSRYRTAPILLDGRAADGRGGGICQVSTALYIAAIRSDLEIVERHPHSTAPDYAPIGLDATIVYGANDLRLKNNFDTPVTIKAEASGSSVTVSLIGAPLPEGRSIDAISRITDRYIGTSNDGTKTEYYVSESFRVYYQDGVKTVRDLLSSDIYPVDPNRVLPSDVEDLSAEADGNTPAAGGTAGQ